MLRQSTYTQLPPLAPDSHEGSLPVAEPPGLNPTLSTTSLRNMTPHSRKLRLIVAATGPREVSWALALVVRLSKHQHIEMRAIVDERVPRLTQTVMVMDNQLSEEQGEAEALDLVEWADMLVCVPMGASAMANMLAGQVNDFLGEVIRAWDESKQIVLVPGMNTHKWSTSQTKRHLNELHRHWSWIRVMSPILWHFEGAKEGAQHRKRVPMWNSFQDLLGIIQNQADLLGLGRDVQIATGTTTRVDSNIRVQTKLPPEIWTIILNYTGDWELAKGLQIYTNLPTPTAWKDLSTSSDPLKVYARELAWTTISCNAAAICKKISESPPNFRDLSAIVVRLVIRFGLIDVLHYLEANRPDLFRAFDCEVLPFNASAYYPRVDVLDYWRQSRWFTDRLSYSHEALDAASGNGHVRVLDWWWRRSGLKLKYTEAALEQASAHGHLLVLEWWRDAAAQDEAIVLRPGRSILWATQFGRTDVLRWWDASGIPIAHGDSVAKLASRWGQVEVLETWRRLKGDNKLVYDAEVLREPTVHGYVGVLEWWRKFAHGELEGMEGRKHMVEFRTCNIEEALEDSIGDQSGVRSWWATNGLNLGVRNEEWLKTRFL